MYLACSSHKQLLSDVVSVLNISYNLLGIKVSIANTLRGLWSSATIVSAWLPDSTRSFNRPSCGTHL